MPKTPFHILNTMHNHTQRSGGAWDSDSAIYEMRSFAREEAKYVLDRELEPDLREFLYWVINNDPHLNAKFAAFRACRRMGVGIK